MSVFNRLRSHQKRAEEQIQKWTYNLRAKQAEKILNHCTQSAYNSSNFFSAFLLTFAPWYFDFPRLPLTIGTMMVTYATMLTINALHFLKKSKVSNPYNQTFFLKIMVSVCKIEVTVKSCWR